MESVGGGKFIVFDGLPGAGKSTMIKMAFEYIYGRDKKYDNILVTDEPTNGPYGLKLRELFKKQKSSSDFSEEIFDLFCEDRKWHIENIIKPCLKKGFVILCDRYKYSSIAYQTVQGIDFEKVFLRHKDFLPPDLALVFDVSPEIAAKRMALDDSTKRKQSDNFRSSEFVSKLRPFFLKMPSFFPKENIIVVDSNDSVKDVFLVVEKSIDRVLF